MCFGRNHLTMAMARKLLKLCSGSITRSTVTAISQPVVRNRFSAQLLSCRQCTSSQSQYTYEISKDPNEWKYVEDLLTTESLVPPPPTETLANFPTPSGWVPQQESKNISLPYYVSRTKNHMVPVYLRESNVTPVKFTQVDKISGDIWALDEELREHLATVDPENAPILTQVHEPGRFIRIRGMYTDTVAQFLLDKGF